MVSDYSEINQRDNQKILNGSEMKKIPVNNQRVIEGNIMEIGKKLKQMEG